MIFKPLGVTSDVAGLVKVKNVKYSQGKIQVKLKASVKTTGRRQTHETLPTGKLVEFMAEKNIPISVSSQSVKNLELSFNLKI